MGARKDRREAARRANEEIRKNSGGLREANREYDTAIENLKDQPVTDYFADVKYEGVDMNDIATAKQLGFDDVDPETGEPLFTGRATLDGSLAAMEKNYASNERGEFGGVGASLDPNSKDYVGYSAQGTDAGNLQRGAASGLSNVFNNLQVSTAGAEMEAQEADQALAASQDLAAQAGTGAGGATALAAAAAKSKQGISASIDQQVKANEQLRAQGEQSLQRDMLSQGNLASQFDLGQQQFNIGAQNKAAQFGAGARNQANQFNATGAAQMSQFNAGQTNQRNASMFSAGNQMRQFNAGQQNAERMTEFGQLNQANTLNVTTKNNMLAQDAQNKTQFNMSQAQGQQGVDEAKYGKQLDLANIAANDLNNQNETNDALNQVKYATG